MADVMFVKQSDLNDAASAFFSAEDTILPELWQECDTDERSDLAETANGSALIIGQDMPASRFQLLVQRGYVSEHRGSAKICCRAIERYAQSHGAEATSLRRLFGSAENFSKNLCALVELRQGQISIGNPDIQAQLVNAIRALDKSPKTALQQIRGIVDDLFEMIWNVELPDRKIPQQWTEQWRDAGNDRPPFGKVPAEGGPRRPVVLKR
jgi:hypothetical protein